LTSYLVHFLKDDGSEIGDELTIAGGDGPITVPVPRSLVEQAGDYLRVEVRVVRSGKKAPRPAEFHLSEEKNKSIRLVGLVH
jgi:hypothetical protein